MKNRKNSFDAKFLSKTANLRQDPISCYNTVVSQYNDRVNVKNGIHLEHAYNDAVYVFWFGFQRYWYWLLFILYLAPYVTIITLCLSLYSLIIHENALSVYRNNSKQVKDLFENMVLNEEICKNGSSHYLYFSLKPQDVDFFPFPPTTKEVLKARENDGKVCFMVYDRVFLSWSENLRSSRCLIWLHTVLNIALFVAMQYYVYTPLFCFNLLHPVESISKCGVSDINSIVFFW
ncbi:unnamed protein product [Blepharisma stoltei]|uniref:Uncharacterized protein n=1 Tax=Blepharisma stoltei TaxID=1481888 RepID=A0AAU9JM88_9CILI|nr:unnamed protein product [Blepharisma stoltei]